VSQLVTVPDIGGAEDVEVIEICVTVGDQVEAEQSLIVLESDKATMEIPAPQAGSITAIKIKVGDKVSEGAAICEMDTGAITNSAANAEPAQASSAETAPIPAAPVADAQAPIPSSANTGTTSAPVEDIITVPDLGGSENVEIIEISVAVGEQVEEEQSLIVLESDKATMEIPAPKAGEILEMLVKVGDKVSEGDAIAKLKTQGSKSQVASEKSATTPAASASQAAPQSTASSQAPSASVANRAVIDSSTLVPANGVHAGPAVRKLARELGVDLNDVKGTGPRGRIQKDDLHAYVKAKVQAKPQTAAGGFAVPDMPKIDFSKFGNIERVALNKLRKVSARNLHRSWVTVPHVTQFDEADITDLEAFRKNDVPKMAPEGVKVTPLAFMLKACAHALKQFPRFNASLDNDGEHLILKEYVNIGVAVETPDGLVVPVIRNVDQKSVFDLAKESSAIAKKARDKKLGLDAMQGGNFSISSLGGIGGTAFTPIVNAPEVAILGVSKAQMKPVWNGNEFKPRLMLPLSLSYDHRVIDGADAARFTSYLASLLSDIRRIIL
jgi:pyruvate dehydrogenase E2 component (dihydrolipoamide acetyltransferase)